MSMALDVTRRTRQVAGATIDLRRIAPSDVTRLIEILLTLARHGVLTVARRGPYLVMQPRDRAPRAMAVALRHSFAHLGPAFVKLGQLIASSPGLFPDVFSQEFRRLLDRVPPEPTHKVKAIIRKELGKPVEELFASFGDEPIAAASIAQVHEAWLHDGSHVAVKIRRPNLSGRVERDLRLMRYLAGIIERSGTIGELANPVAIVEDFGVALRSELDFHNEAASAVEFEANLRSFGENDRIVVPAPVEGMVAKRVMVMSFIEGVSVDNAERLVADDHNLEELLQLGIRSWMEAALIHGFFHGDVHAGNLFITPDSKVVYLDFGIMGRLGEQHREALLTALPAVLVHRDYTQA
ncbi:MAG: AarF/UbiB family protein, partial [Acidimicrobiales bacterium]